jgi:hypothetical protein
MKKEDTMRLWKKLDFVHIGEHMDIDGQSIGLMPLMKDLLSRDTGHLTEFTDEGVVKQEVDKDAPEGEEEDAAPIGKKYVDYMTSRGGRVIHKFLNDGGDNYIFMWKDGVVDLDISGTYVSVRGMSQNETFIQEMKQYFSEQWAPPERVGHIYAIIRQGMHLGLSSLGNAGIPLVEGNYTPKVMEDYKFVIKDLLSESPSGRISIMTGVPGTGKTHLIRAMLLEVPDAMFVLISPEMVTNLAGPELLPLLLSHRGGTTGPIVLVLEDADKCLVARDKENMNSIQSLLNLGDGILGSLLDLRIIATTNAKELHMEEAIMRPGRLSKMLEVGALDLPTARGVFERLLPGKKLPKVLTEVAPLGEWKMTLAEAYALARKHGWVPNARKIEVEKDEDYDDYN